MSGNHARAAVGTSISNRGGNKVRLILRASSTMDAWIDSIWISRPGPAGDPYNSAADLKQFYGKARIRANTRLLLPDTGPEVKYNLFASNTLLIAVDFERGAPSGVRYTQPTGPNLTAYFCPRGRAAGPKRGGATDLQVTSVTIVQFFSLKGSRSRARPKLTDVAGNARALRDGGAKWRLRRRGCGR